MHARQSAGAHGALRPHGALRAHRALRALRALSLTHHLLLLLLQLGSGGRLEPRHGAIRLLVPRLHGEDALCVFDRLGRLVEGFTRRHPPK